MSKEQIKRVIDARIETQRIIDKATSYMHHHQDAKLIAQYRAHLVKLDSMILQD